MPFRCVSQAYSMVTTEACVRGVQSTTIHSNQGGAACTSGAAPTHSSATTEACAVGAQINRIHPSRLLDAQPLKER